MLEVWLDNILLKRVARVWYNAVYKEPKRCTIITNKGSGHLGVISYFFVKTSKLGGGHCGGNEGCSSYEASSFFW